MINTLKYAASGKEKRQCGPSKNEDEGGGAKRKPTKDGMAWPCEDFVHMVSYMVSKSVWCEEPFW